MQKGNSLFGSEQNFRSWLYQENNALGYIRPIELLQDPEGISLVEDALGAMEYGNLM